MLETLSLWVLVIQFAATFSMVGLVWFVQHVHYPLLGSVGSQEFRAYERAHVTRTTPVVGPPMLTELGAALAQLVLPVAGVPIALPWLGVGLLAVIWLSTALLQVPRHRELSEHFDPSAHRHLVATNWIRTWAWSLRGLLLVWMMSAAWAGAGS